MDAGVENFVVWSWNVSGMSEADLEAFLTHLDSSSNWDMLAVQELTRAQFTDQLNQHRIFLASDAGGRLRSAVVLNRRHAMRFLDASATQWSSEVLCKFGDFMWFSVLCTCLMTGLHGIRCENFSKPWKR